MGDIVFNPVSIIFYCFGIIIPTIMLLYSFGHIVFTVGEYKESDKTIPMIILLLVIKLFVIGFIMFFVYHILFDYDIPEISMTSIIVFLFGNLITFDTNIINKSLLIVDKFVPGKCEFRQYLKCASKSLFERNPFPFYGKVIMIVLLSVCLLISFFFKTHESIGILEIIFVLYLWINYKIFRYVRKLRKNVTLCNKKQLEDGNSNHSRS
jgi:hypothetical protein